MEYDSHTMLYILPKKDEYKGIYKGIKEYKFELSDEYNLN